MQCPRCGHTQIRRSARRGWGEYLLSLCACYPFRCLRCDWRFRRLRFWWRTHQPPAPAASRSPSQPLQGILLDGTSLLGAQEQAYWRILCPQCRRTRVVQLTAVQSGHPLYRHCGCGYVLACRLERRHDARVPTRLAGQYHHRSRTARVLVENVSRRGLGLRIARPHTLAVHEVITVRFRLDDPQRSVVRLPAVVQWVDNERVGAALRDEGADREAHRRLGMYVRAYTFLEQPRGAGPARATEDHARAGQDTSPP